MTDHDLLIREAVSKDDLVALHMLRMIEAEECAPVPVNPEAVLAKLARAAELNEDHFMLMATVNGRLAGHLCIERVQYWYAPEHEFLTDFGFYVLPKYRNSDVAQALLEEACRIATLADLPITLFLNNPNRRRGSHTKLEKLASLIRYVPAGAVLAFNVPTKDHQSVLRQQ